MYVRTRFVRLVLSIFLVVVVIVVVVLVDVPLPLSTVAYTSFVVVVSSGVLSVVVMVVAPSV